jgi:flagellar motility protein MotE (MotC chaperone)
MKLNLQDEIRRVTNETAAAAASKALEVSELAKSRAAEVSSIAMAKALEVATLAATKAADAASAAANIAAATSKDLEYIKKDIADTKADIKAINEKLDNKYATKEELRITKEEVVKTQENCFTKKEAEDLERRVTSIEGNLSKAVWIVLSVVILAILSVVVINYKL